MTVREGCANGRGADYRKQRCTWPRMVAPYGGSHVWSRLAGTFVQDAAASTEQGCSPEIRSKERRAPTEHSVQSRTVSPGRHDPGGSGPCLGPAGCRSGRWCRRCRSRSRDEDDAPTISRRLLPDAGHLTQRDCFDVEAEVFAHSEVEEVGQLVGDACHRDAAGTTT